MGCSEIGGFAGGFEEFGALERRCVLDVSFSSVSVSP